jgi:hypothetical protein
MNSLERSLVEKAGYDNGWERSSTANDDSVSLASSMHGFTAAVRKGSHSNEWAVRFSDDFPLGELRREFPSSIFRKEEALPWDYQTLCALLRRAAEIAIAVPDAPQVDRRPASALFNVASRALVYGESWNWDLI